VPIRPAPKARIIDCQPTPSGTLVELRPLCADDYDALYAAAADPAIWEQHQVKDRHREDVFRPYFDLLLESREALVVLDSATGEIVGLSRYHGYDAVASEVEIGWTFLVRSRWGGPVNRELKSLMLRHAFRFVHNVVFLIDPENRRSQRAVEKVGGVRIAPRLNAAGVEIVVFRICRKDFGS
jgi:RimJ/RimL family protein N-acetyltransferase